MAWGYLAPILFSYLILNLYVLYITLLLLFIGCLCLLYSRHCNKRLLCYVMLCYVMLCYVMLCYVKVCYVMLCYVMLCYGFEVS